VFLAKLTIDLYLDGDPDRTIDAAQPADLLEPSNMESLDQPLFLLGHEVENDDEQVVREHYTAFRNQVVSQLECDGAAACWHLTGEEIDAAMATLTDDVVALPDGGRPSPTLPNSWRAVSRPDQRVFQRADRGHYIVPNQAQDILVEAIEHDGFAHVDFLTQCPTWNKDAKQYVPYVDVQDSEDYDFDPKTAERPPT
jgi:hypothetical protein